MITSFQNPLVKRIKRLRQKKYRLQEESFFAEGLRIVLSAIENGAEIETIVYCSELLTSENGRKAVIDEEARGRQCVELARPVFEAISERDNPVGLGAILQTSWIDLYDLTPTRGDLFLALMDIAEPGNLGTILRTADAVGAGGIILFGETVDPFHPTAVKASMGAIFTVPICRVDATEKLWRWAEEWGVITIATSAKAKDSFWQTEFGYPAVLLMGSEKLGLKDAVIAKADCAVKIPMWGSGTSLNLAVATGILLYELKRKEIEDPRTG